MEHGTKNEDRTQKERKKDKKERKEKKEGKPSRWQSKRKVDIGEQRSLTPASSPQLGWKSSDLKAVTLRRQLPPTQAGKTKGDKAADQKKSGKGGVKQGTPAPKPESSKSPSNSKTHPQDDKASGSKTAVCCLSCLSASGKHTHPRCSGTFYSELAVSMASGLATYRSRLTCTCCISVILIKGFLDKLKCPVDSRAK